MAGNFFALVICFFANYSKAKARYNIKDINIWNMDEMGYTIGFTYNTKVVILYGNIRNFKIINGLKEWVN
jgi:hypothetical protein